jgi:hypothetical protein
MISPHAPSVIDLNSLISSYNSFWREAPFWKTTGKVTIQANMAMTLRPMAAEAARSVGVILSSSYGKIFEKAK